MSGTAGPGAERCCPTGPKDGCYRHPSALCYNGHGCRCVQSRIAYQESRKLTAAQRSGKTVKNRKRNQVLAPEELIRLRRQVGLPDVLPTIESEAS